MRFLYFIFIFLLGAALSCKKDPVIPNEEELITTLIYTLTPVAGGPDIVFSFRDLDGDGGAAPEISTQPLSAETIYMGVISLLNEAETPSIDIGAEVEEESDEHQFFYIVSGTNTTIQYADTDDAGFPVGLLTNVTAGENSAGSLRIILRHLPVKHATGVSAGDITHAGGETDIEVIFPLIIE